MASSIKVRIIDSSFHVILFLGVMCPDGIMVQLYGPFVGRRHDAAMLYESGLLQMLEERFDIDGHIYSLYGDPAYPHSPFLMKPFTFPTGEQRAFNSLMSSVRECVEWGFGKTLALFQALDFSRQHMVFKTKPAIEYKVATFLANCHTCATGSSQIADYFGLRPPTLEEYLA